MNFMIFKDSTRITIDEGATLDHIVYHARNEADALFVCEKCTADNVSEVKFGQPGEQGEDIITGEYSGLLLATAPTRQTEEDGIAVTVTISLYEPSALELRVAALEESQGVQDEAIDDLGGAVSDMMEG